MKILDVETPTRTPWATQSGGGVKVMLGMDPHHLPEP